MALAALLGIGHFTAIAAAGDGWQVGDEVRSFYVREMTSDQPNLATCLVCRYGTRPVVLVCVYKSSPQAERLILAIDRAVDQARGQGLRGFALFLSPQPSSVQSNLLRLARQGKLSLPLTLPVESGGPGDLPHPAETSLTVYCYSNHKIVSRTTLPEQITDAHLSALLSDVERLAE